jgi:hypothetical protein
MSRPDCHSRCLDGSDTRESQGTLRETRGWVSESISHENSEIAKRNEKMRLAGRQGFVPIHNEAKPSCDVPESASQPPNEAEL